MTEQHSYIKEAVKGALAGALFGSLLALALFGAMSLSAIKAASDAGLTICAAKGASHD